MCLVPIAIQFNLVLQTVKVSFFVQSKKMSTLDDKILGEKTHYYCSSSEDENDNAENVPVAKSESVEYVRPRIRSEFCRRYDSTSVNVSLFCFPYNTITLIISTDWSKRCDQRFSTI